MADTFPMKFHSSGDSSRPETGVCEYEGDWPGVFIRGDNACYYGFMLKQYLKNPDSADNFIGKTILEGLANLLLSCEVQPKGTKNGDPVL